MICPTCMTLFWPKRANQQYCSKDCIPKAVFKTASKAWQTREPKRKERCEKHNEERVERPDGRGTFCRSCRREEDRARKAKQRKAAVDRGEKFVDRSAEAARRKRRADAERMRRKAAEGPRVLTEEQRAKKRARDRERDAWRRLHALYLKQCERFGAAKVNDHIINNIKERTTCPATTGTSTQTRTASTA